MVGNHGKADVAIKYQCDALIYSYCQNESCEKSSKAAHELSSW